MRKDGTVHSLRPEWAVGAHASGANSDSIGVCFEGDYMTEEMPRAQLLAGADLIADLMDKYGVSTVLRHRDVGDTNCPGDRFPWRELTDAVATPNLQPKEDELIRVDIPTGTYPVYRAYREVSDDHFFTGSESEYLSLPDDYAKEDVGFYGADTGEVVYRLYDPNARQHHYTTDHDEAQSLVNVGWKAETVTFASAHDGKPVYRVYNPNTGAHHFTADIAERDHLVEVGWNDEGIRWYAAV